MEEKINKFQIKLDSCLLFAIKTSLKKLSKLMFNKSNLSIEKRNDLLVFDLIAMQCSYYEIYCLGGTIFDSIYKWNNVINKIVSYKPYKNPYTGDLVFLNEFEEELLEEAKINGLGLIPEGYQNKFVMNTKSINQSNAFDKEEEIEFEIDLVNNETIYSVIADYNKQFNKNFIVKNLYQDDQLYFATIYSTKANINDIFYLGYLVELNSVS
jgi:hypothetical protein